MEVPFISSGAISRAHYALVSKVEAAVSVPAIDQHLMAEVQSTRNRLGHSGLSNKQCKECLIILLHCAMSASSGILSKGELDFALPHAVNLAETGTSVYDKRIGYLFCAEIMPAVHELQLMLVNTLRKDLETSSVARICLALDTLITSPTEDVIPAVQSRLHDLLSHNSSHVRRRSILAFRALSRFDNELLNRVTGRIQKRIKDQDDTVVNAALIVCSELAFANDALKDPLRDALTTLLLSQWRVGIDRSNTALLKTVILSLSIVGLAKEHIHIIQGIIRLAATQRANALLYSSFVLLSRLPLDSLSALQTSSRLSPVHNIRHLITTNDPNESYLFVACLECLDPNLWAGTTPENPPILEGWEVERVMLLLESSDRLIRKKTLRILNQIDTNIVESYFVQNLETFSPTLATIDQKNDYMSRLLDVVDVICAKDGEGYARRVMSLFQLVESSDQPHLLVERAIELVLVHIRAVDSAFRIGCATTLVSLLTDVTTYIGASLMVIISALASEYSGKLAVPPVDVLQGICSRLSSYTPGVQEACLLSMLRIVADCEEPPKDVVDTVTALGTTSKRHIKKRCEQFVTFCGEKDKLRDVIIRAQSPTLPDFLEALEPRSQTPSSSRAPSEVGRSPRPTPPKSPVRSVSRLSAVSASVNNFKLRYAAYDAPKPVKRMQRSSASQSSRSDSGYEPSDIGSSRGLSEGRASLEHLSQTLTPGDLALAVGDLELDVVGKRERSTHQQARPPIDDPSSRPDLITLDSPFLLDPAEPTVTSSFEEPDFEGTWNAFEGSNTRGWCEVPIVVVVRRLQGLDGCRLTVIAVDRLPFEGDLKILIFPADGGVAALRLRDSEDDSCLWRLRSGDEGIRTRVKRLLSEV